MSVAPGRYETLGLVTTYILPAASILLVVLKLIASLKIGVNQQFYSWGAIKKVQVRSAPKKLKHCILPSYQSGGHYRKIHSSPVQYLVCSTLI